MDHWRHVSIPVAGPTGLDMRNHAGSIVITTFGQMDRCHRPTSGTLLTLVSCKRIEPDEKMEVCEHILKN